tara:strand:+ start:85685 stop:87370 length:1686 start_codon:yes stop_codon:yes gene_type:complete
MHSSWSQQDLKKYEGNWIGTLPNVHSFNFNITLAELKSGAYNLIISNGKTSIDKKIMSVGDQRMKFAIDEQTHLELDVTNGGAEMNGFIKSGVLMYHINLKKIRTNVYQGSWNPLMIDSLQSQSIYLSFENYDDGSFAVYPFFGDQRFSGTWAGGFVKVKDVISFRDVKTGFKFKATLLTNKIQLEIIFYETTIAVANLVPSTIDLNAIGIETPQNQSITKPIALNDGWVTTSLKEFEINPEPLARLIDSINNKSLVNTHSVLISKKGTLVFETYFDGYKNAIPHDQRSAAKSISSAIVGIAIDDRIIMSTNQRAYDLLPMDYQKTQDTLKEKISIKNLLTMSSGLDAIDFGIESNSVASENNYQNADNWLKTVVQAPMINEPGTQANYGSANPFLLGVILDNALSIPLEFYLNKKLFAPLGITNYIIQTDDTTMRPYLGGGMYLTSRDMLKFGLLYLNKGTWEGQQIISKKYVEDSFKKYLVLENTNDKNEYGYLWWHKTYDVKGKHIESVEARGSGGQYLFVIPELELVVVITSGNYRNGKFQQPEKIISEYILPAILN